MPTTGHKSSSLRTSGLGRRRASNPSGEHPQRPHRSPSPRPSTSTNDSGIADEAAAGGAGGLHTSYGTAGSGGSLPLQMPGRSYYGYRKASSAAPHPNAVGAGGAGGAGGGGGGGGGGAGAGSGVGGGSAHLMAGSIPMSLTQSSFDIREGSARLASLGLSSYLSDQYIDELEFDRARTHTSNAPLPGIDTPTPSTSATKLDASVLGDALLLSASSSKAQHKLGSASPGTGNASLQNTPSGLSVLMQKHESLSAPSSPASAAGAESKGTSPSSAGTARAASAAQQHNGAGESADSKAQAGSSEGSDTIGRPTPTPGSPDHKQQENHTKSKSYAEAARGPVTEESAGASAISVSSTTSSRSEHDQHLGMYSDKPRAQRLSAVLEARPALNLPLDVYTERSPLIRKSRPPSRSSIHMGGGRDSRESSADRKTVSSSAYSTSRPNEPPHYRYRPFVKWSEHFDRAKSRFLSSAQEGAEQAYSLRKRSLSELALAAVLEPIKTLPAVILGILMNLLDGVSYGMIMFPVSSPVFASFGGIGVSMFFASCFVSQVVFSTRSIFKGGNGSMMIEAVPFLHVIAFSIQDRLGGMENTHAVVATTMVAYALTGILTGLVFFLLGYLRLGAFTEFFPRIVLIGCIGGVGAFLVITGVEVCAGLENETLELSWTVIKRFFEPHLLVLWLVPLGLAAIVRIITSSRFNHPMVFPAFFLLIPIVFYIIVFAARIPISTLREGGWIFDVNGVSSGPFEYFTLFDFKATDFAAVMETIPTQLALVFFALLHVPINVPALALSVGEDNVVTDTELVNHGLSNFLAGCLGTIPNYLVYTNSVLFYRVGGTTRLSSFMLALATLAVFLIGPWVIGYLPVMIVGTLIYILGYDLLKEAVWDTWGRVSGFDYCTIWIIILAMTYFDFVVGIGVGIVVACISFVIVSSQRQPIRAIMSGVTASSTVRRHPRQSAFLRRVGSQTRVIKLQGFLFFGTVVKVEAKIRDLLEEAAWHLAPIRFLLVDFSLASGVDFSAAEAFLRVQRLLQVKNVILVVCGCGAESPVGKALNNVDLFSGDENLVRVFSTLNDALEHCENSQLRSLYSKTLEPSMPVQQHDATSVGIDVSYRPVAAEGPADGLDAFSPRRTHLLKAANETFPGRKIGVGAGPPPTPSAANFLSVHSVPPAPQASEGEATPARKSVPPLEPVRLLMQALGPYAPELREDFFLRVGPAYFSKKSVASGTCLWKSGDIADCCYVLESGILKATYEFLDPESSTSLPPPQIISESMLPGTMAGEMTFLAASRRNATVIAERDAVLWKMDSVDLARLEEKEGPGIARSFRQVLLRVSAESADVLMGHLISG